MPTPKVFHYQDIEAEKADEGAVNVKVRWLITKDMGAPNFAMRLFEVESGGSSPYHKHPWEHEVFILEGEGKLIGEDQERAFGAGDVVFVAPDEMHQFKNDGKTILKFLCLVPHKRG